MSDQLSWTIRQQQQQQQQQEAIEEIGHLKKYMY